jgi:formylglycine-generating enzyme required for sulfatase activity
MKKDRLTDPVKLPPLFGMSPNQWVPLAYIAGTVLLLFALLVLPGIAKHGSILEIRSLPPGAAVEVDGLYLGATPVEEFVSSGEREIIVSLPGYSQDAFVLEVPGRLFGSLFFPRREALEVSLTLDQPELVLSGAFDELTSWSYIGEANSQYQFPPSLSQGVEGLAAAGFPLASSDILLRGSLDAVSDVILKDLLAAAFRADAGPGVLSGASVAGTATALAGLAAANPRLHLLAETATDGDVQNRITSSDWYSDRTAAATTAVLPYTREGDVDYQGGGRRVEVAGIDFYELPSTVYVMGRTRGAGGSALLPGHPIQIDSFFIGTTETTRGQYLAFVEANPEWSLAALDSLLQSGLVSEDYLLDWIDDPPEPNDQLPVVNVSAHAAEAYAAWVTDQVEPLLPGYRARLPYEAEWEWAAEFSAAANYPAVFLDDGREGAERVAGLTGGPVPIYDLAGNVWEWNANAFHRASYLVEPPQHAPAPRIEPVSRFAHRAVRGGSWANLPGTVDPTTRASQPVWWCTPYLGFRLVLVEE